MWLYMQLYKAFLILKAKILHRKLALVDEGDPDGIVSGALFKMKYPPSIVVPAYPGEIKKNPLIKGTYWDFVADLPCPGKARVRADHHLTNTPCAEREFYDPGAPAAALMALKALQLEDDPKASKLVSLAVETDTANITSPEAMELEAAVKGADYKGKLYIIQLLAERGVEALSDDRIKSYIERYRKSQSRTEEFSSNFKSPPREAILLFKEDKGLSYRYLTILLERAGAELTFILVPKGFFKYRVYAGAKPDSSYNAARLVTPLGGGGHRFAAGATFHALSFERAVEKVLPILKKELGRESIDAIIVEGSCLKKIAL